MREPTIAVECSIWRRQGATDGKRIIPEETAVAFTYDGGSYAVMMATPQNLEDFALGFSFTEGLVSSPADIRQLDIVEQLCDRVGIIQAGRMVVTGTVTELRSSGPHRYWVDAPMAGDDWTTGLGGVTLVRREGSRSLLELADGADEQAVLRTALATGPVREFRRDIPPLSELFRHVVAEARAA